MKKALLRRFMAVLVVALLVGSLLSAVIFDYILTEMKETELTGMAAIFAELYDPDADGDTLTDMISQLQGDTRITLIAADGTVLGDSEADYTAMDNHLDRDEIQLAAQDGSAVLIRTSSTIGKKLIYAVVQADSGIYVRISQEYNGVLRDMVALLPGLLLAGIIAMLVSGGFSAHMARTVSEPIRAMSEGLYRVKHGDTRLDAEGYPYDELKSMAQNINDLAEDVSTQIGRLQEEKARTDFLLDNIDEGFVLLDQRGCVRLINNSACAVLGLHKGESGQPFEQAREPDLLAAMKKAYESGEDQKMYLHSGGKILRARFTHVDKQPGIEGNMILTLTDVTAARRSMQMRQEFFSNASHELKTPITAIKGSAELLCSDLPLQESQRQELLTRIGQESERMNTLIQDIIMLSRIESGGLNNDIEVHDLENIVLECVGEARPLAVKNRLTITTHTEKIDFKGSRKNHYELFSNLIMNAVKYNVPDGKVELYLERADGGVSFRIRNDGDPIPLEQQERVFERFYRVDHGRSRAVGGTGLGLSIVKHIVDAAGGTIRLTSNAQEGTWVSVFLPEMRET